jgi:sugar lactone lactonase YvrE
LYWEFKIMGKFIFAAMTATIIFGGCSSDVVPSQPGNAAALSQRAQPVRAAASSSLLYVGNYQNSGSNVLVFADSGKTLKRTVALPNSDVEGIAVDAQGNLFAASGDGFNQNQQSISVFKNNGAKAAKTLQQRFPFEGLTVDGSGDFFVGCGQAARRVCEYPPAKRGVIGSRVVRRIPLLDYGVSATHMTTDASGNLAVSDQNHVSLFAPGAKQPYLDLALGLFVGGVAFDQSGNLYVALLGNYDRNEILVYAPGNSKPLRSFSIPSNGEPASALAFDAAGNLYALLPVRSDYFGLTPDVLVFAPNGSKPIRTITKGMEDFTGYPTMAVGAAGDIYVADGGSDSTPGSVVVYEPNQSKPRRVITTGIQHPDFLAVGP